MSNEISENMKCRDCSNDCEKKVEDLDNNNNNNNNNNNEDGFPDFEMVKSNLLVGQSQYLGGDADEADEYVYFVPGHAAHVLVLDTRTDELFHIGPKLVGQFKWLRSIRVGSIIYGLPCHANSVLRIDTNTREVTTLALPVGDDDAANYGPWKYHGGAISPIDGKIYAMPQYATRVLQLDPQTDTLQFVGPRLPGRYKWYGAILGSDNAIYGIPHNAANVIRIDPSNDGDDDDDDDDDRIVTLFGDFEPGGHKWHGGAAASNGKVIVGIPCHANTVLHIDVGKDPKIQLIGDESIVQSGRHQPTGKYKFLGANVIDNIQPPNNNNNEQCMSSIVYFLPSGAERILQYEVPSNHLCQIGPNLRDTDMEPMLQNKWQNGFTCNIDGAVYAIPKNGNRVLRIHPGSKSNHETTSISTVGPSVPGLNKWEGCVETKKGVAYCVPENFKGILKIIPKSINS